MKRNAIKYIVSLLLAVTLLAFMPVIGDAVEANTGEIQIPVNKTLPTNDELFASYVDSVMCGETKTGGDFLPLGTTAREQLNSGEKALYDIMRATLEKVADGEVDSSKVTMTESDFAANGIKYIYDTYSVNLAMGWFQENYNLTKIINALLTDCPYDLYWFDKTLGVGLTYSYKSTSTQVTITQLTFKFPVCEAYRENEMDKHTADTEKTGAAKTAYNNAVAIVNANAGLDDYKKLSAYDVKIRDLVDYNYDAAADEDMAYGDPWQLIWVFDNDPSTKVVCEGYSKAFQLLCDLSEFNGDIECVSVSGVAFGGGHMWNIVQMENGKNYLVDVTNTEYFSGGLFLRGATGSVTDGYFVKYESGGSGATFTYEDRMIDLFGLGSGSILNLSEDDYVYSLGGNTGTSNSGKCGDNLTWSLENNGELVIKGTGAMWDYGTEYSSKFSKYLTTAPWGEYADKITKLSISGGITYIGKCAFYACEAITGNLIIPDSVTEIGEYAFQSCRGFNGDLNLGNGVVTIGKNAFYQCNGFAGSFTLGNNVKTIGEGAFSFCNGFKGNLVIPNGVEVIGNSAFSSCGGFTGSLVIPNSVTKIGNDAFSGCYSLSGNVTIGTGVKTIGSFAFSGCSGLKGDLVIPGSVTSIGMYAFNSCTGFNGSLTISDGVEKIDNSAFNSCTGFTGSLTIPGSVTTIVDGAFFGCSGLSGCLTISDGVETIGYNSFYGCKKIEEVVIGQSVQTISGSAFYGCSALKKATVYSKTATFGTRVFDSTHADFTIYGYAGSTAEAYAEANSHKFEALDAREVIDSGWCGDNLTWTLYDDGELVIEGTGDMWDYKTSNSASAGSSTTAPWGAYSSSIKKLSIVNGATSIGKYAFSYCDAIAGDLIIPDSVKTIGNSAFHGCGGFTGDLVIGNGVTTVGTYAFNLCSGFKGNLTIGNSVETIGQGAFSSCSGLTGDLIIPDSVKTIDWDVFSGCSGFTGDLVIGNGVTSIGGYAFSGCSGFTGDLVIGNSLKKIADQMFYGFNFKGSLTIGNSVETIGKGAFAECRGFTGNIVLPSTITVIGESAFYKCVGLTGGLSLPEGLTTIGDHAFNFCGGLTGDLIIPDSVTTIGECAFQGCGFSGELKLPNGITTIEVMAFNLCTGLTGELIIPNSVTTIGECAFQGCGFTGILKVPDGVTSIGNSAFKLCSGLTEITLPADAAAIGDEAFSYCSSLEKVTTYTKDAAFGSNVFAYTPSSFTIYGYTGSTAETYAKANSHKFVALSGVTVTGTIMSFLSETDTVTIELIAEGATEAAYTTTVTGKTATYTLEGVAPGTYTLRVSKATHATREYEVVVGDEDVTQDVKIHLLGDINGDGKINVYDAGKVNSHAKKVTFLTGYELICADVDVSGKVNVLDAGRVNSHAKKVTLLW